MSSRWPAAMLAAGTECTHMPNLTRRYLLSVAGAGAAGLVIGIEACSPPGDQSTPTGHFNKWVSVTPDNVVRIRTRRIDMGQGSQTGLAQIVADEMDADWSNIEIEM